MALNATAQLEAEELKYLLILDFEATCGDAIKGQNEIIEFPTLLYNLEEDEVQATFHEYVRPEVYPTLTAFCTNLTGITQVPSFLAGSSCVSLMLATRFVNTYRILWMRRRRSRMSGRVTKSSSRPISSSISPNHTSS